MKKAIIAITALLSAASSSFAFIKGVNWSTGYTIASVRTNSGGGAGSVGWIGFTVVPKDNSNFTDAGGWVHAPDAGQFFIVKEDDSNYKSMSAAILTAKSMGKTIEFCVCGAPAEAGVLWDLSRFGGVGIEP